VHIAPSSATSADASPDTPAIDACSAQARLFLQNSGDNLAPQDFVTDGGICVAGPNASTVPVPAAMLDTGSEVCIIDKDFCDANNITYGEPAGLQMRTANAQESGVAGITGPVKLTVGKGAQLASLSTQCLVVPGVGRQYTLLVGKAVLKRLNAYVVPDEDLLHYRTDAGPSASLPVSHSKPSAAGKSPCTAAVAVDLDLLREARFVTSTEMAKDPELPKALADLDALLKRTCKPSFPYSYKEFWKAARAAARFHKAPATLKPARKAQLQLSARRRMLEFYSSIVGPSTPRVNRVPKLPATYPCSLSSQPVADKAEVDKPAPSSKVGSALGEGLGGRSFRVLSD
jgi:hypothetical protein